MRWLHPVSTSLLTLVVSGCGVATSAGDGTDDQDATVIDFGDAAGSDADGGTASDGGSASDERSGDDDGGESDEGSADPDTGPLGPLCGNGVVERGEACDDNNNFPNDGCNPTCTSDERCSNGIVDASEQCDDGDLANGDGCDNRCRLETGCGNGTVEVGEQCDDSNRVNGDGCSSGCVLEIFLAVDSDGDSISDFDEGNGFVDTEADGTADSLDLDSDNDGITDATEAGDEDLGSAPLDTDSDDVPDFRDLDTDGDAIPDAAEGAEDPDSDELPNYRDLDADGDYVPDSVERNVDTDGDGTADYLDTDSDNDSILDRHELFADSEGDGRANRIDTDSDNDGVSDSVEAGDRDSDTYPIDTDADGIPDYIDLDADADGLPDSIERGCAAGSTERLLADSDADGYSDLAEQLVAAPACTPTSPTEFRRYTDFFFILPYNDPAEIAPLEFATTILKADVHFNIDSSGSMGGEIGNLRERMSSFIVPRVAAQIDDVGFGFSDFRDCTGYAWRLRQRVTTNVGAVQAAINGLGDTGGGYEPTFSTLWHIGTGASAGGCLDIPTFNPASGSVPGVADGNIGGVGFRGGAFPVVVHITDEAAEDGRCGSCAKNADHAVGALNAIRARVIGVASESPPRDQLRNIARRTGAVVPACAWDGARPAGCGPGQCCTGVNGAGQAAEAAGCPLVFDISNSGNGLAESAVTGIVALVNTSTLEVTTRLRRDEDEFRRSGVDTRCFIQSIRAVRSVGRSSCSAAATPADISPIDGVADGFRNVTPGTSLYFDVQARNVCATQTDLPQSFFAYIDVIGDGVTVLDTQSVTVIVPARFDVVSTIP